MTPTPLPYPRNFTVSILTSRTNPSNHITNNHSTNNCQQTISCHKHLHNRHKLHRMDRKKVFQNTSISNKIKTFLLINKLLYKLFKLFRIIFRTPSARWEQLCRSLIRTLLQRPTEASVLTSKIRDPNQLHCLDQLPSACPMHSPLILSSLRTIGMATNTAKRRKPRTISTKPCNPHLHHNSHRIE